MTALIAILVIAVVAFGVWYVTKMETEEENTGSGLQVTLGSGQVQE